MAEEDEKKVTRWDPFRDLDLFEGWGRRREPFRFPRLLDDLFGERSLGGALAPAMDVSESDDQYAITLEVPGVAKDDVTVEVHENVMTIRGEKKSEREEKKEKSRWIERRYGSFSRSFTLPSNADPERVKAAFKDGVLTIEIAKVEESKPKVISIKS
jgi:HSP20 family protein